jgi:hypothetical protein
VHSAIRSLFSGHCVVLQVTGEFVVHRVVIRYCCDGLNGLWVVADRAGPFYWVVNVLLPVSDDMSLRRRGFDGFIPPLAAVVIAV